MKRSVAIMLVGLLVLFSLIACSPSTTDTNPYSTLQFPSELRFGMSAEEVANTLSIEIAGDEKVLDNLYGDASYDSEYIGGYDKLPLNNNCAVCSVIYKFDNPRIEEFKDQRTLNQVSCVLLKNTEIFYQNMKQSKTILKFYTESQLIAIIVNLVRL